MIGQTVHLVGFGSQGSAWAQCLRKSGWDVQVYLHGQGKSFSRAEALGFSPSSLETLPGRISETKAGPHWIAFLCPDSEISTIYDRFLAASPAPLRLILAHGFTVYSGALQTENTDHRLALLAPKAIGPKLLAGFEANFPQSHSLRAAFHAPGFSQNDLEFFMSIARGIGFDEKSLISATFDQETVGDLISEQGLLCGGVFNLLRITYNEMTRAGIPSELIEEECLTELELVAGLIREKGPLIAFQSISQAAQAGTVAMDRIFQESGVAERFQTQAKAIEDGKFARFFQSKVWVDGAKTICSDLGKFTKEES